MGVNFLVIIQAILYWFPAEAVLTGAQHIKSRQGRLKLKALVPKFIVGQLARALARAHVGSPP